MNTPMANDPAILIAMRAPRKVRPDKPHRRDVDEVAKRRADGAADGDEDEIVHAACCDGPPSGRQPAR